MVQVYYRGMSMTSQNASSTVLRFLEQQIERKLTSPSSQAQTPQGNVTDSCCYVIIVNLHVRRHFRHPPGPTYDVHRPSQQNGCP